MPFDPKLIREEDADFGGDSLKLPDDLAFLAEQLGDDAARLSATYPPKFVVTCLSGITNRQEPTTTLRWLNRSLAGTALATGLVAISLLATNFYAGVTNKPTPVSGERKLAGSTDVPDPSQPPIPVTPASWLGETSGPEMEALMDLWEHDQPAVRSLSF